MKRKLSLIKKNASLLIALMLLLCGISCQTFAEDFTLRNGITFGDTMEDVKSKETIAIDKIDSTIDEGDDEKDFPYSIVTKEDTVAGISGSQIVYRFDKDGKLGEVEYSFKGYTNKDLIDSDYEAVNQGLVRKYGSPLGYTNGKSYIVTGGAIDNSVLTYSLFVILGGVGDMRDYDEWVVNLDDYNVKIEQVCYYWGNSYSDIHYSHKLGYTRFTNEQLQDEQNAKQEKQDAVDNDI